MYGIAAQCCDMRTETYMPKKHCNLRSERLIRMMVDRLTEIIVECDDNNINFDFCCKQAREEARKELDHQWFFESRGRERQENE